MISRDHNKLSKKSEPGFPESQNQTLRVATLLSRLACAVLQQQNPHMCAGKSRHNPNKNFFLGIVPVNDVAVDVRCMTHQQHIMTKQAICIPDLRNAACACSCFLVRSPRALRTTLCKTTLRTKSHCLPLSLDQSSDRQGEGCY